MGTCSSKPNKQQTSKKSRKKAKLDECAQAKAWCCCCCCCCSLCTSDELEDPYNQSKVFNARLIGYDDYGNLRYKIDPAHVADDELSQILSLDSTNRDGRELWYVIDACWCNEWLLFVHTDKAVAPSPGPVYNKRLLMVDEKTGKLVAKPNLVCEGTSRIGDYRRVSRETWEMFVGLYPGSGPAITTVFRSEIDAKAAAALAAKLRAKFNTDDETNELYAIVEEESEETAAKIKKEEEWRQTGLFPTENWLVGDAIYEDEGDSTAPVAATKWLNAPANKAASVPARHLTPGDVPLMTSDDTASTTLSSPPAAAGGSDSSTASASVAKKPTVVTKVAVKKKVNEDLYADIYSNEEEATGGL